MRCTRIQKLLCMAVLEHNADLGIAIDGDGDRLIMVDDTGAIVDGDELLYIIAQARKSREFIEWWCGWYFNE